MRIQGYRDGSVVRSTAALPGEQDSVPRIHKAYIQLSVNSGCGGSSALFLGQNTHAHKIIVFQNNHVTSEISVYPRKYCKNDLDENCI